MVMQCIIPLLYCSSVMSPLPPANPHMVQIGSLVWLNEISLPLAVDFNGKSCTFATPLNWVKRCL